MRNLVGSNKFFSCEKHEFDLNDSLPASFLWFQSFTVYKHLTNKSF